MRWTAGPAAIAALSAALCPSARADEPMFGYVNTTDLLPRGKSQVEQWLTLRADQAGGRYSRIEARTEAEYGLRDDLQVTGYLNYSRTHASRNGVDGLTGGPGVPAGHDPARPYRNVRFDSVTGEIIWRLTSPYLSPVGVALLADATVGEDERAGRLRAIAQKNLREDTLILAANLWLEMGRRPASGGTPARRPKATTLELDAGVSYRFRPNWSAALEYRRRAEFSGYGFADADYTADFLGPTLHYGGQRWFATLSVLRQIGASAKSPALRAQVADGLVFGTRHTRWDGIRFRLGRTF